MRFRDIVVGAFATLFATLVAATGVNAAPLFISGPIDGQDSAIPIMSGYAAADAFILASPSTVTGATFATWTFHGDISYTADWIILRGEPGPFPIVLASGTASIAQTYVSVTLYPAYDLSVDTILLSNINLGPGTYWFELENVITGGGVNGSGTNTLWDITPSPATPGAWASGYGDVSFGSASCASGGFGVPAPGGPSCSNVFTIEGGPLQGGRLITDLPVPEPSTWTMLLLGFFGVGLVARRSRPKEAVATA